MYPNDISEQPTQVVELGFESRSTRPLVQVLQESQRLSKNRTAQWTLAVRRARRSAGSSLLLLVFAGAFLFPLGERDAQAVMPIALVAPNGADNEAAPVASEDPVIGPAPEVEPQLMWPISSMVITSRFGSRKHPVEGMARHHRGVDVKCKSGTPVLAAADGLVTSAQESGEGGLMIRIGHETELSTVYAHLAKIEVKKGQFVRAGERIGLSGATGLVTGPHLHFEIWKGKLPRDPMSHIYLSPGRNRSPHSIVMATVGSR